jgi:hypothetical protein
MAARIDAEAPQEPALEPALERSLDRRVVGVVAMRVVVLGVVGVVRVVVAIVVVVVVVVVVFGVVIAGAVAGVLVGALVLAVDAGTRLLAVKILSSQPRMRASSSPLGPGVPPRATGEFGRAAAAASMGEAVGELLGGRRTIGVEVEDSPASAAQVLVGERVAHPLAQAALDLAEPVSGRQIARRSGGVGIVDVRHRVDLSVCMYGYKWMYSYIHVRAGSRPAGFALGGRRRDDRGRAGGAAA